MIITIETVGATGMQMHLTSPKASETSSAGHWLWSEYGGWKPPKYVFQMTGISVQEIEDE